ncbi:MAG: hypothetical protein GC153_13105 [Alphaproteobacteria bacterium]|nr:hypothetical protein [Alphaproteobacteria bacterium]
MKIKDLSPSKGHQEIDIGPGVGFIIRPVLHFDLLVAQAQAQQVIDDLKSGIETCRAAGIMLGDDFDVDNPHHVSALYKDVMTKELAVNHITGFYGVVDDATGEPVQPTPEIIRGMMDRPFLAQVFTQGAMQYRTEVESAKKG